MATLSDPRNLFIHKPLARVFRAKRLTAITAAGAVSACVGGGSQVGRHRRQSAHHPGPLSAIFTAG